MRGVQQGIEKASLIEIDETTTTTRYKYELAAKKKKGSTYTGNEIKI